MSANELEFNKGEQAITKEARERAFAEDEEKRCKCHQLLPGLCPTKWMDK
jgi:uncharacterized OsmC-like protein|tara:strand:+ start:6322 stop:6471 length:150 start_codon:yes stop_codon:yes gene_type:complete